MSDIIGQIIGGGGRGGAAFDGAASRISWASLTGQANSKLLLMSLWNKRADGEDIPLANLSASDGGGSSRFIYGNGTKLKGSAYASGFLSLAYAFTGLTSLDDDQWNHMIMAIDLTDTAKRAIYVDDAAYSVSWGTYSNVNMDFTPGSWDFGHLSPDFYAGNYGELYFAPGQWLDITITANRRKFIDATGKPVSLGVTGSTPTGVAPLIYLSGGGNSFANNRGSGGAGVLSGTLGAAGRIMLS